MGKPEALKVFVFIRLIVSERVLVFEKHYFSILLYLCKSHWNTDRRFEALWRKVEDELRSDVKDRPSLFRDTFFSAYRKFAIEISEINMGTNIVRHAY